MIALLRTSAAWSLRFLGLPLVLLGAFGLTLFLFAQDVERGR